jgi:hypothetical protein
VLLVRVDITGTDPGFLVRGGGGRRLAHLANRGAFTAGGLGAA